MAKRAIWALETRYCELPGDGVWHLSDSMVFTSRSTAKSALVAFDRTYHDNKHMEARVRKYVPEKSK